VVKLDPLTKLEKQNFERFGCTFRARPGIFCIDWRGNNLDQASRSKIFATLGTVKTEAAPLVILAFEISPVQPLPHYCYFPFDLTNQVHMKYLSRVTHTGEIKICFVANKRIVERTHQLTPYLRSRVAELYAEALQDLEKSGAEPYDFEGAVPMLERSVRIPELLTRVISEDDFPEILKRIKHEVQLAPPEKREFASRIVQEALEAFKPWYGDNNQAVLNNLQFTRRALVSIADLHRLLADNSARDVTEFLSDGIAASFSQADLENLNEWLKVIISVFNIYVRVEPTLEPQDSTMVPQLPRGLGDAFQLIATGRGISLGSLRKFGELLGLEIGGKPGRPTKDYALEYSLKASGLSWSKVTRQTLRENSELCEEFGGREFDSLTFEEREGLMNRIRQGVNSYAERVGKPLPPRLVAVQPAFAEGEQKTPKNSALQRIPPDKLPS
jgi:hypothetical protein